jgi:hypothetical protein
MIGLSFFIDITISNIVFTMEKEFGGSIVNQLHIFINASDESKIAFCDKSKEDFVQLYDYIGILNPLVIFSCIGYLTAVIQKFTVLRLKDNV